jgi:tetratricopeptide (TPR) repeat protein
MKSSSKQLTAAAERLKRIDSMVQANKLNEALAELKLSAPSFVSKEFSESSAQFNYLLGFVLWRLGESRRGLEPTRKALDLYLSLRNFAGIGKSENLIGWISVELGNIKEAEEHLQLAVSGYKMAGEWGEAARALNRLGYIYHVYGKMNLAAYFVEQARECAVKAGDRYFEEVLACSRSVYLRFTGNWKPIPLILKEFLVQSQKTGDFFNFVFGLINLGHSHFLAGDRKEARKNYLKAVRICIEEGLTGNLKVAYEYLAELDIAEGRFAEAEGNLKKALEIGERVSPYGTIMTQCWRLMGDLRLAQKEYDRALEAYATCRSYLIKLPEKLEEGAMCRGMGICHIRKDQFSLAQVAFKKAIEIFEACENDWELAKTYVEAAECGAFALAELRPKLAWARGIFHALEHPSWERRVEELLGHAEPSSNGVPLRLAHELADRQRVAQALSETKGNISHAAEKLGISRPALHYKIKRYKLAV